MTVPFVAVWSARNGTLLRLRIDKIQRGGHNQQTIKLRWRSGTRPRLQVTDSMTTAEYNEYPDFDLAFELGFFIHANKEVAFFIAEDALDELPLVMGKQQGSRKPSRLLSGFWKGGERARPIRQTIRLTERQMLQWLCYKQSEYWERQTERGSGVYTPTEEDMIVRYLAHLLFLTLRRGSFYVSLAIGQLLHQFDRRETRLFYDILTQSDSARMKDTGYIGKQRLELLKKICQRFNGIISTTKTNGGEKHIVAQKVTEPVANLVHECLKKFTPSETVCIINPRFDVTDIPGLYSSGSDSDEDRIEMHRIHTVIDPDCFRRFVEGLCEYAQNLPDYSPDNDCNFEATDQRLAVPRFTTYENGQSGRNRFRAPSLAIEDYIRLRRTLETRSRRRRSFSPKHISIYGDSSQVHSFNLATNKHCEFSIGPDTSVIEVRGSDEQGELLLATLLVDLNEIPTGSVFKDTIVDQGGQQVEIKLSPIRDSDGCITGATGELTYAVPPLKTFISKLTHHYDSVDRAVWRFANWATAGLGFLLLTTCFTLLWFHSRPREGNIETSERAKPPIEEGQVKEPSVSPKAPGLTNTSQKAEPLIARATWSRNPEDALSAIVVEPTRGEVTRLDFSGTRFRLLLSLPLFDDDRVHTRYRVGLIAKGKRYWQQSLNAPKVSLTGSAHILILVLHPKQLSPGQVYDLQIEGLTSRGWAKTGHVLLAAKER